MEVRRMLPRAQKSMTTRSRPTPMPPCGAQPYLKASMYDWMVGTSISCTLARSVRRTQQICGALGRLRADSEPLLASQGKCVLSQPLSQPYVLVATSEGPPPHHADSSSCRAETDRTDRGAGGSFFREGQQLCSPTRRSASWIRCAPEMISSPRMKTSKELLSSGLSGHGIV